MIKRVCFTTAAIAAALSIAGSGIAQDDQEVLRARDLGVPFAGTTGPLNAITDVAGVEVGHLTLIEGDGALVPGEGPIRTGVTAIHPRGKGSTQPVFGAWFALNGSGEMTGTTWLEERGQIDGPILITNTHSVGIVRDAAVAWMVDKGWPALWHAPVVAETYDGFLNDTNGQHVTTQHALSAMANASGGIVKEGNVGGGTGMLCNGFKGGIGTSSRQLELEGQRYTVGVLVQCNYGRADNLRTIAGVDVAGLQVYSKLCYSDPGIVGKRENRLGKCDPQAPRVDKPDGSIIIVIATDAPLLPHQLKRVAKRPSLAIGRLGGIASAGSGDIFIAFSTANKDNLSEGTLNSRVKYWPNNRLTGVFAATIDATEEAIVNAMVAAQDMTGIDGAFARALPEDQLAHIMRNAAGRGTPSKD